LRQAYTTGRINQVSALYIICRVETITEVKVPTWHTSKRSLLESEI